MVSPLTIYVWIGAKKVDGSGNIEYMINGEALDISGDGGDCVVMRRDKVYILFPCDQDQYFACEVFTNSDK